jgi:hypothetical protein
MAISLSKLLKFQDIRSLVCEIEKGGRSTFSPTFPLPVFGCTILSHLLWDNGQKQVRRILLVMIDLMEDRITAADVIRDILNVGGKGRACGQIQTCNIQADTVSFPE